MVPDLPELPEKRMSIEELIALESPKWADVPDPDAWVAALRGRTAPPLYTEEMNTPSANSGASPVQSRAEVLAVIAAHTEELRALGVAEAWVFGSAARDELRPGSDVDVWVKLSRPLGLAFFDIADHLEGWLRRRADVMTFGGLHERVKGNAVREAIRAA